MTKILFVAPFPHFLPPIVAEFEQRGYETTLIPQRVGSAQQRVHLAELAHLLYTHDVVFFEFCTEFVPTCLRLRDDIVSIVRVIDYDIFRPEIREVDWGRISLLITVSETMWQQVQGLVQNVQKNIIHPVLMLDPARWQYVERKYDANCRILLVGRCIPKKRIYSAIQMLAELNERYTLRIVGDYQHDKYDFDGYLYNCLDLAETAGVADRVEWVGKVDDDPLLREYQSADIILSNSMREAAHYAVAEGMLTGCYPLVHFWRGADAIYERKWLFVTVSEFVQKITRWAQAHGSTKRKWAREASDYIAQRYDVGVVAPALVDKIEAAIAKKL